jgi:hypothetical protein
LVAFSLSKGYAEVEMKAIWIVLGLVLVLCCGGGIFFGSKIFMAAKGTVEGALEYGDASLKAVATRWEPADLKSRMAKEVFEQNPEGAIDNVAKVLSDALGPIKAETLTSRISGVEAKTSTETGSFTLAQYFAEAEFEKGKGEITMELIHRDGEWRILKFNGKRK